jgi:uncharacterized protein YajQ (UPF0234 family)
MNREPIEKIDSAQGSEKNSKKITESLEKLVTSYLASNPIQRNDRKINELEIRFNSNTRKFRPLSKIDYDNVVKFLYSFGFKTDQPEGFHSLRIFHEYMNSQGKMMMSNIRTEIVGLDLIQEYCRTNSIQKILDMPSTTYDKIKFTQKTTPEYGGEKIFPVIFEDFNLKIAYQLEQNSTARSDFIRSILEKWTEKLKTFRYLNRVRFHHPEFPIFADISIVRSSKSTRGEPTKTYDIQDSGVFEGVEKYEIEMEIDNARVGTGTEYKTTKSIIDLIRKSIRIVLSGLQGTHYPISYTERDDILFEYMTVVKGDDYQRGRVQNRDFIGPSSVTLQLDNIMKKNTDSAVPNITMNYTVTDKADGERRLLFVNKDGKIYMIDTNMNVIFTGSKTVEKTLYHSILDGEFIKYNKNREIINLFAAFDIYFIHKKTTRDYDFTKNDLDFDVDDEETKMKENTDKNASPIKRYLFQLLQQYIGKLKPFSVIKTVGIHSVDENNSCTFTIKCKNFFMTSPGVTIFQACSRILSDIDDGIYPYTTDGLIFTPSNTAVGSDNSGQAGPLQKITWGRSFKWKPPEFNTIDFLVSIKKDKTGKDEIHNIFQNGKNVEGSQNFVQYKTLELRCGFNEKKDGYLQPFQDIIENKLPSPEFADNESAYKPVKFQPTNPSDDNACFANIILREDKHHNLALYTSDGDFFEDHMIVEFSYNMSKSDGWKWVPLRVRYDKTAELRNGIHNFGNAYHVANSIWQSIHRPISSQMISEGKGIPELLELCGDDEVENDEIGAAGEGIYYNRSGTGEHDRGKQKRTGSLRDFHNLFIKRKLILGVSNRKDTLIDYAVGKAGDLSKWVHAQLGFVFGIDVSKDNIHNRLDGACARFLSYRKKQHHLPSVLFVNGNSSKLIRNGDALSTTKDKEIAAAVFGNGPKDVQQLGQGVYNQYGAAADGFNVSSCQFALHYFWENKLSLHTFLRNISECTKLNGYFIGTCYDGETVFKLLKNKNTGESVTIFDDERKIFELTKQYSHTGFSPDDTSIGYPIHVYQETINKTFREYLVNFNYLVSAMSDYGFMLVEDNSAKKMDLPSATGLFSEMFDAMESEIKRNPRSADDYGTANMLTTEEKRISFLNRYFVFRKTTRVNTEKVFKQMMSHDIELPTLSSIENEFLDVTTKRSSQKIKIGKPKGKRVTILANSSEIITTPADIPITSSQGEPEEIRKETNVKEQEMEEKPPKKIIIKIKKPNAADK